MHNTPAFKDERLYHITSEKSDKLLEGRKALQFLDEMFSGNPLKKTLGIAVLNALSSLCWKREPPETYRIRTGVDAFDEMIIPDDGFVAIVGALTPVIKALMQRCKSFAILERDPLTLKDDEMEFLVPPATVP